MKIIELEYPEDSKVIEIVSAKYLGIFTIKIAFNDGTEKFVDFKPFLTKSQHPAIRKYLSEKLFMNFQTINGNLNWNDYDMIFPIEDLYEGRI
jgi:hypothetical protein